jgi:lipoprotein signal peptidase
MKNVAHGMIPGFFAGLVTGFMVVRAGPFHTGVINLADLAIVVGTVMLLVSLRARARGGGVPGAEF